MKYLYCITDQDCRKKIHGIRGIHDAPVTTILAEDIVCVVSDIDTSDASLDRDAAMAHQKVLETVMEQATILPLAFGHIVQKEEEVARRFLAPHADAIKKGLTYLSGNIEMNIKAFWPDIQSVFMSISEENEEIRQMKKKSTLTRNNKIRAGEIAAKAIEEKRGTFVKEIIEVLQDVVIEHKKDRLFGDSMIANIAFLLPKKRLAEFDTKINLYAERFGNDVYFRLIGPVPPYNFTNVRITV
jgi:hypothetical protein